MTQTAAARHFEGRRTWPFPIKLLTVLGSCNNRAYGKAPTFSTTDPGTFKRAIDMTDDELVAIIARAKPTLVK
jgi:hypothetical protein